jgi:hypothetical protein
MVITHLGQEFFKVGFGDITIALNPVSKDSKLKTSKFGADIALSTTNHADMNGFDQVSFGDKKAFEIRGPGEYEVKEVFIKGFPSESQVSGEKGMNTIYTIELEGMHICFLGALSNKDISSETLEAIDDIDILFVPIGGKGVLAPADAYKLAVKLEPKLVIPMHWSEDKSALKQFLKEAGEENTKPVDKLMLKKKDLEGKEADVIVLEPAA